MRRVYSTVTATTKVWKNSFNLRLFNIYCRCAAFGRRRKNTLTLFFLYAAGFSHPIIYLVYFPVLCTSLIYIDGGVFIAFLALLLLFGLSSALFLLLSFQFTKQHHFIAATGGGREFPLHPRRWQPPPSPLLPFREKRKRKALSGRLAFCCATYSLSLSLSSLLHKVFYYFYAFFVQLVYVRTKVLVSVRIVDIKITAVP